MIEEQHGLTVTTDKDVTAAEEAIRESLAAEGCGPDREGISAVAAEARTRLARALEAVR